MICAACPARSAAVPLSLPARPGDLSGVLLMPASLDGLALFGLQNDGTLGEV